MSSPGGGGGRSGGGGRGGRLPPRVTATWLRRHPLPLPGAGDDKVARGRVLVAGGSVEVPGAVVLAGVAALRAGAGRLQLATCASVAAAVGVVVPEARVISLPQTMLGGLAPAGAGTLARECAEVDAFLLGPGLGGDLVTEAFVRATLRLVCGGTGGSPLPAMVLDAGALAGLRSQAAALCLLGGRLVLTPHAGEMASLLGTSRTEIERAPLAAAREVSRALGAVVALKGPRTFITTPDGDDLVYEGGAVGLATSGSGDTLAGIVVGLLARGAEPLRAAAWGAYLHGGAGNVLVPRRGPVGYLARELLDEIPAVMARLTTAGKGG